MSAGDKMKCGYIYKIGLEYIETEWGDGGLGCSSFGKKNSTNDHSSLVVYMQKEKEMLRREREREREKKRER